MRVLLFLGALLVATPAFALGDAAIDYCFSTPDPKACIKAVSSEVEQRKAEMQRDLYQQQLQAQMEIARMQMQGMMLFGTGPALIHGMNQGFHQMQLPYVNTPAFSYSTAHP